jgi:anti-sigma factor ChrR (cupin superfamily)
MAGLTPTCKETVDALSDLEEGILPLGQYLKVRAHLFNCPSCRSLRATLRALPRLAAPALAPESAPESRERAARALAGALARIGRPGGDRRPWPATPVPEEALQVLASGPDPAMRVLASTHELIARERTLPAPGPAPGPLPAAALDLLPPADHWVWRTSRNGGRRAELLADASGCLRLALVFGPPGSTYPPHRHLGSESILVLQGRMEDWGRVHRPGDWVHLPFGSCHAPRVGPDGCWWLVREEGGIRFLGPSCWHRLLRRAS